MKKGRPAGGPWNRDSAARARPLQASGQGFEDGVAHARGADLGGAGFEDVGGAQPVGQHAAHRAALGAEGEEGALLRLSAIGIGDVEPVEAALVIRGEALKPPSPVHVRLVPDGAGGWRIGWTRRSRDGWRWSSGGDVPLGEESERYELRVLRGAEVKRRAETAEPVWLYDAAMVSDDMAGAGAADCILEIRQIGSRAMGRPARVAIPA